VSDTVETKVCPHCAETIKAAAKVCPRCRSRLERERMTTGKWLQLGLYAVFSIPFALGAWWLRDMKRPGEPFENHRNQLVLSDTAMHFKHSEGTNIISTVGYLHNESPFPWRNIYLEVQYFDGDRRLVDTKTEWLDQELPAGITEAFRIRAIAVEDAPAYVSNKVFVRAAVDARPLLNGN
jgi:hypothetical protein